MTQNSSYHDAEIVGLFHEARHENISLNIIFPNGQKSLVTFSGVIGWDLSPLEEQNCIFDLHEFDKETMPKWIKKDFEIPKEYIELINSKAKKLFYIEPSVGLGGYIVAKEMKLTM